MKRILFALALIVAFDTAASAQTKRTTRTVRRSPAAATATPAATTTTTTRTTRTERVRTLPGATVARQRNEDGFTRPSPYLGDRSPANDGQKKNKERNLRVNNTAEPLPTNAGE